MDSLRLQTFFIAESQFKLDLLEDEDLHIPPDLVGKIELDHVLWGVTRVAVFNVLENCFVEPEALIIRKWEVPFDVYRNRLLAKGYSSLD